MTTLRLPLVLAVLASQLAFAEAPLLLGYQGRLTKLDGTPETGNVQLRFSLFSVDSGGALMWEETQQVALTEGFYATYLGKTTFLPAAMFDGPAVWLELSLRTVNDTAFKTMVPRQRVGSVAYALSARDLRGGSVDATTISINGTQVFDGSGRLATAAGYVAGPGVRIDSGSRQISLNAQGCTVGQVLQWTGAAWQCTTPMSSTFGAGLVVNGSQVAVDFGPGATQCVPGDDGRLAQVSSATPMAVASTLVKRDATGGFAGTLTGNATNVTGVVALANGGTGATTPSAARTALGLGNVATLSTSATATDVLRGDGTFGALQYPVCNNVGAPEGATNKPCLARVYRCPSAFSANGVSSGPWASYGCVGQMWLSPTCLVVVSPQSQTYNCSAVSSTVMY